MKVLYIIITLALIACGGQNSSVFSSSSSGNTEITEIACGAGGFLRGFNPDLTQPFECRYEAPTDSTQLGYVTLVGNHSGSEPFLVCFTLNEEKVIANIENLRSRYQALTGSLEKSFSELSISENEITFIQSYGAKNHSYMCQISLTGNQFFSLFLNEEQTQQQQVDTALEEWQFYDPIKHEFDQWLNSVSFSLTEVFVPEQRFYFQTREEKVIRVDPTYLNGSYEVVIKNSATEKYLYNPLLSNTPASGIEIDNLTGEITLNLNKENFGQSITENKTFVVNDNSLFFGILPQERIDEGLYDKFDFIIKDFTFFESSLTSFPLNVQIRAEDDFQFEAWGSLYNKQSISSGDGEVILEMNFQNIMR